MLNEKKMCQNYLSGFCTKGLECPFIHQNSNVSPKNNNSCFFSKGLFFSHNNFSKKTLKKKNFFEDFEDLPLKPNRFYSQSDFQKMSQLNEAFSNFDLFNEIKDEDNKKIKYCQNFLENKCIDHYCELYHGYNNNFKNITIQFF